MDRPRWPMIVAACVGALVIAAAAFFVGRGSAPSGTAKREDGSTAAVRVIGGAPVGVERSRAGALAAADNYVATSSQTIAQDPQAFTTLVRSVWVPAEQAKTLREAKRYRELAPDALENYANGGNGLSVIGARKLEAYSRSAATVLTWGGGFVWGPNKKPAQRWFLVRTKMVWDGDRWRVKDLDELKRDAPVPYSVTKAGAAADTTANFDRALEGMSAPIYGAGG
jgi:hypothetical protein